MLATKLAAVLDVSNFFSLIDTMIDCVPLPDRQGQSKIVDSLILQLIKY